MMLIGCLDQRDWGFQNFGEWSRHICSLSPFCNIGNKSF